MIKTAEDAIANRK